MVTSRRTVQVWSGLVGALVAGSAALECQIGTYVVVENNGTSTCDACPAGRFMNHTNSRPECYACPPGHFSTIDGAAGCEQCFPGYFSATRGSTACESCAKGRYAGSYGMSACVECAVGTSAPERGRRECDECPAGRYASELGTETCEFCTSPATSLQGSSGCEECESGYYYHTMHGVCHSCPKGGLCLEGTTLETIEATWGFYRFTETSSKIYPCPETDSCRAGPVSSSGGSPCEDGAEGPLCAACKRNFYRKGKTCVACRDNVGPTMRFLVFALGSLALVIGCVVTSTTIEMTRRRGDVVSWGWDRAITADCELNSSSFMRCRRRIGVLVSSMQTILFLRATNQALGGPAFPGRYDKFLDVLGFLALDVTTIFPWPCVEGVRDWTHNDSVVFWLVAPIGAAALCGGLATLCSRGNTPASRLRRAFLQGSVIAGFFLGLPLIFRWLAQAIICKAYDQDDAYAETQLLLATAPSVSCSSSGAQKWRLAAYGGLALYASIAVEFFIFLAAIRAELNPRKPPLREHKAVFWESFASKKRSRNIRAIVSPVARAFSLAKRPSRWWYDLVVALPARTAFGVGILWVPNLEVFQAATLAFALLVTFVEIELRPFLEADLGTFSLANHGLVILVLVALLLADSSESHRTIRDMIGWILLATHGGLCALCLAPTLCSGSKGESNGENNQASMGHGGAGKVDPAEERQDFHSTEAIDTELANMQATSAFTGQNPMFLGQHGGLQQQQDRSTTERPPETEDHEQQPSTTREPNVMGSAHQEHDGHPADPAMDEDWEQYLEVSFERGSVGAHPPHGSTVDAQEKLQQEDWNGI